MSEETAQKLLQELQTIRDLLILQMLLAPDGLSHLMEQGNSFLGSKAEWEQEKFRELLHQANKCRQQLLDELNTLDREQ